MSRPQRAAAAGVNYKEPGDYPDLSDSSSESSHESVFVSSVVADPLESEESVLLDSTVVNSQETQVCVTGVGGNGSVVSEPLCESSPKSSSPTAVCALNPEPKQVVVPGCIGDREAADMAEARANQLVAELEALMFQLDELIEDVSEGSNMSTSELSSTSAELKDLRVRLVKASHELKLVSNRRDHEKKVNEKVESSKVIHRVDELNIIEELGSAALLGREILSVVKKASVNA